jgi:hypothetical protein
MVYHQNLMMMTPECLLPTLNVQQASPAHKKQITGAPQLLQRLLQQQAVHRSSSSGTFANTSKSQAIMAADAGAVDERYSGTTFAIQEEVCWLCPSTHLVCMFVQAAADC